MPGLVGGEVVRAIGAWAALESKDKAFEGSHFFRIWTWAPIQNIKWPFAFEWLGSMPDPKIGVHIKTTMSSSTALRWFLPGLAGAAG